MALNIFNGEDAFEQGIKLHFAGRLREAEQCYQMALQSRSDHAGALYNMGIICVGSGRLDLALDYFRRALAASPTSSQVYNGIGEAYRAKHDGNSALTAYAKSIELDVNNISAYNNRGIVLAMMGRIVEAAQSWEKAIDISNKTGARDDLSLVYNNVGNAYMEQGEVHGSIENHRISCKLDPKNSVFFSNLLRDYNHAGTQDGLPMGELLELHREWWRRYASGIAPATLNNVKDPEKKLRVGFVSPDFREHSVMYFLMGLFEHFDRGRFEFICYGNGASQDNYTQWTSQKVTTLRNVLGMRDEDLAQGIQVDGIDILIDLAGHTSGSRLGAFAYKPAPVQATYLGYPMTTGSSLVDWRITDAMADPEGMTDGQYTERLWRLDRPAWCFRFVVDIEAEEMPPVMRGESGEKRPFTFGTFNNFSKVTGEMIATWARILRETGNESRLLLKSMALRDPAICENVRKKFAGHGIVPERLLFSGKQQSTKEHLQRYWEVDVALDTFPYEGTTTTCEALWMNVPVVTMAGETHVSRVGVSLLSAVGLQELIGKDVEEYVGIAVGLAKDVGRLAEIRKGLRGRMKASALSDEVGFARAFESALRGMWREYCAR